MNGRLALFAAAFLVCAAPLVSYAQPRRPTQQQVREAARVYQEGLTLMEGGNPEAALPKFRQAYDLASPPNALFNIGACYEALRSFEQALEFYERYLVEASSADDRRDVQQRIAQIRSMKSYLSISSEPTQAQIFVDNAPEPAGSHRHRDRAIAREPRHHHSLGRIRGRYQERVAPNRPAKGLALRSATGGRR